MHLKEIRWRAAFDEHDQLHGIHDQEGSLWKFNTAVSWHDFEEEVAAIRINQLCQEASKHRAGQGMENGVDWSVSHTHYNILVKEGKTDRAAPLMSIQTGALWSPARLAESGIKAPQGGHVCPLCGEPNVDEGHLF